MDKSELLTGIQNIPDAISTRLSLLKRGGLPLLPRLLEKMNRLFQVDFTAVRIHLGAESLLFDSPAFASGNHIFLLPEMYRPDLTWSQEIIAHELTHVLQQQQAEAGPADDSVKWIFDEVLEMEATRAGKLAAQGEPIQHRYRSGMGRPTFGIGHLCQTYTVVNSANFATNVPQITVNNPRSHSSYGHSARGIGGDSFVTQVKGGRGALSARSFLRAGNRINYRSYAINNPNLSLRVSQNGEMVIQNCNLNNRQPKVFYATDRIIDESNHRLVLLESNIRLDVLNRQQTLTIGANTLRQVMPRDKQGNLSGLAMNSGDCASVIEKVMGVQGTGGAHSLVPRDVNYLVNLAGLWEFHLANGLNVLIDMGPTIAMDYSSPQNTASTARNIAIRYALNMRAHPNHMHVSNNKLNHFAAPEVGDGFLTNSLRVVPVDAAGNLIAGLGMGITLHTIEDHMKTRANGILFQTLDRRLTWGDHWGGIVAKDGNDVITLENYARDVEDALATDGRYYFQMYNTSAAAPRNQTWHGQWVDGTMQVFGTGLPGLTTPPPPNNNWDSFPIPTHRPASPGARSFTNPISCGVTIPNTRYDAIALN